MDRKATMDQFDRAFEEVTQPTNPAGPTSALVLGVERTTIDAIRASLEVVGFNVSQVSTVAQFEKAISQEEYGFDCHNNQHHRRRLASSI